MPNTETPPRIDLLPADALRGKRLGLSVSESPDLARLGLFDDQMRMTLGELARSIIVAGGDLYYGGHLKPDGYTRFLIDELQRYGRRDKPLKVCLAWNEHSTMRAEELADQHRLLGLFGELIYLAQDGERLTAGQRKHQPTSRSDDSAAASLTSVRRFMAEHTDARIVIGGKRAGFEGEKPGIVEEVLLSLERHQPIYLAGGFGGATIDVIGALRPAFVEWFPKLDKEVDAHLAEGLSQIRDVARASGWDGQNNGLTNDENRLLAATYRPSEIAALVGLGMGRLFGRK